jgi:alpha-L-rhamnosidase
VLAPGFTDYDKRVPFQAHDVTDLVHEGDNVIGAVVGGGWCTAGLGGRSGACGSEPPRVMIQLEVTLTDGSLHTIMTDESWHSHPGPVVASHLYDGEKYDARLEMPEWSTARFDARDWEPVEQYDREQERDLVADRGPPIRVMEDLEPLGMTEPTPGVYVFDFGQNVVGWARIALTAPAATPVTLRFAEAVGADGAIDVANLRGARATDEYIARGDGMETWEPRFTLHGFRFVEVKGLPSRASLASIAARVVHSQMAPTGMLETSDPRVTAGRVRQRPDDRSATRRAAGIDAGRPAVCVDRMPQLRRADVLPQVDRRHSRRAARQCRLFGKHAAGHRPPGG